MPSFDTESCSHVVALVIEHSKDPDSLFSMEFPFVTVPLLQSAQLLASALNTPLHTEYVSNVLLSAYAVAKRNYDVASLSTSKMLFLLFPNGGVCSAVYILNISYRRPEVVLVLHPDHRSDDVSAVAFSVIDGLKYLAYESEIELVDSDDVTVSELFDQDSDSYGSLTGALFDDSNDTAAKLLYMHSQVAPSTPVRANTQ